jgi:uncharacterized membrane protein YjgN (DUF898 family)
MSTLENYLDKNNDGSYIPPQMTDGPIQKPHMRFFGSGSTYFGIVALNVLLTILTLGLYYPWAKAAYRKYLWNETEFKDSKFVFNGTGKEMFKGFVIAYAIILALYFSVFSITFFTNGIYFLILIYLILILLMPLAIFGGWRYRVTRTSWRGIFFSFDGKLREFFKLFFVQLFFTIITFGIYGAWMRVNIMKYLFSHTKIGGLQMDFHGDGGTLFGINILGGILFYPTLGMYLPIFMKQRFEFTINHTSLSDGTQRKGLRSTLTNGEAWKTMMLNFLLLVVTLGLAFPWVMMRTMRMYFNNVLLPETFDYDELSQAEQDYGDATGDELSDIFDMGLDF